MTNPPESENTATTTKYKFCKYMTINEKKILHSSATFDRKEERDLHYECMKKYDILPPFDDPSMYSYEKSEDSA